MAGYCTSVHSYFYSPAARETTAQECNIQPYYLLSHQIIDLLYTTLILRVYSSMCSSKVVAVCIFNKLQAVGLFLAFDGASPRTDPFTSGKKYCKLVNNAVFIRIESLVFVSAVATSAFQLEHTPRLLRSVCHGGYQIQTIE